jgi:hypothetical protein
MRTPLNTAELLPQIGSSRPAGIDPSWDCAWRRLAFTRAQTLVRWSEARAAELHDALELFSLCREELEAGFTAPARGIRTLRASPASSTTKSNGVLFTVHVSPSGDDMADGTVSQPVRTLQAALDRTRTMRRNATYAKARLAIQLGAGTYYMSSPLVLTPQDSLLLIRGPPGAIAKSSPQREPNVRQGGRSQLQKRAVLSGGVRLDGLVWSTHSRPGKPDVSVARLSPAQLRLLPRGIPALRLDGKRAHRARYPNANPEVDLFPKGWVPISKQTSWHAPEFPPYNAPGAVTCDPHRLCGNSTQVCVKNRLAGGNGRGRNLELRRRSTPGRCHPLRSPRTRGRPIWSGGFVPSSGGQATSVFRFRGGQASGRKRGRRPNGQSSPASLRRCGSRLCVPRMLPTPKRGKGAQDR